MRWTGHVACSGYKRMHTGFRWGNLKERDHLADKDVDVRK